MGGRKGAGAWACFAPLLTRIPKIVPDLGKLPKFRKKRHGRRKGKKG